MADTKFDVPIWHKTNLTIEEADEYSGRKSVVLGNMYFSYLYQGVLRKI